MPCYVRVPNETILLGSNWPVGLTVFYPPHKSIAPGQAARQHKPLCGKYCQCGYGKCPLADHNYTECVQIKAERKHFCRGVFFSVLILTEWKRNSQTIFSLSQLGQNELMRPGCAGGWASGRDPKPLSTHKPTLMGLSVLR